MAELLRQAARGARVRRRTPRCCCGRAGDRARSARPRRSAGTEPLSEREVEVLRLLATDLTGPEIAQRLFMSVNTFRTHTRHIFTKLDVNTRRAAVTPRSRARACSEPTAGDGITTPVTSSCDVGSPRRLLASWTSPERRPAPDARSPP